MVLENKRFFTNQSFHLSERSLYISKRGVFDAEEFEISLEDIHNKKRIQISINNNFLFLFFSLFFIGVLFMVGLSLEFGLFLLVLGVAFFILSMLTKRRTVSIATYSNYTIELFYKKDDKDVIMDFADQIIKASNHFLFEKYGTIDKALPIEGQLNNLNFLRDRDIITNAQFEDLKDQLLGKNVKSAVGFTRH